MNGTQYRTRQDENETYQTQNLAKSEEASSMVQLQIYTVNTEKVNVLQRNFLRSTSAAS